MRKSRARVFESGVRNTRVRSSYTRTGYRGGQCKGFLIIRYTIIKISRELLSRLLCGIFSWLCKPFFLFLTFFCPVERGNQAGSSWNEFDYSRRGTRTSVPHLDCRSCDNFGLLLAKIPIIWLGKKDQTEPPFWWTASFSDYTIEKLASPKFSQLRPSRSGKLIRVPLWE